MSDSVHGREVGQYPLSIATSLAIESATNIHTEKKKFEFHIRDFNFFLVNIKTLFRNVLGAANWDVKNTYRPRDIADALFTEMGSISSIVSEASGGKTQTVFYFSDYAGLDYYKNAVPRVSNTERQKAYFDLLNKTLEVMLPSMKDRIKIYKLKIREREKFRGRTLILTHYAYDLLSADQFQELVLLESHTGNFKEQPQWYTKYYNGKDLPPMPFREDFIQVFGDNEIFRPMNPKIKNEIIELAKKYKWNAGTTDDRIKYGISQIRNFYAKDIIMGLKKA